MNLTAKEIELLKSKQVITKKRVLADKLQELTRGNLMSDYLLQYWPTSEIINELRLRMMK